MCTLQLVTKVSITADFCHYLSSIKAPHFAAPLQAFLWELMRDFQSIGKGILHILVK